MFLIFPMVEVCSIVGFGHGFSSFIAVEFMWVEVALGQFRD